MDSIPLESHVLSVLRCCNCSKRPWETDLQGKKWHLPILFPYSLYKDWQTSNGVPAPRSHLTFANSTRFSLSLSHTHTHTHTYSVWTFTWSSLPCPPFHTMSLGSTGGFCLFPWRGLGFRLTNLKRQCDLMTQLLIKAKLSIWCS